MALNTVNNSIMNVGAVGIVGTFLGMPIEALILGALAGSIVHGMNRKGDNKNGIAAIMTSTLLSGAFSPAVIIWAVKYSGLPEEVLSPVVPVVIGGSWSYVAPLLDGYLKNYLTNLFNRWSK